MQHEKQEELEFGGDNDKSSNMLQIGDNFAILVIEGNVESVDFYVLQCQQPKFLFRESFAYVWGGEFAVGDFVVVGTYYQKWGRGINLMSI